MIRLNKNELSRWKCYHKTNSTAYCKINGFVVYWNNSREHEFKKLELMWDLVNQGNKVICEAVENDTGLRRDLVDLTDDIIYEIESTKKRAARFKSDPKASKIEVVGLYE